MILNLIVVLNTACDRLQISQLSQLGKIIFRFDYSLDPHHLTFYKYTLLPCLCDL